MNSLKGKNRMLKKRIIQLTLAAVIIFLICFYIITNENRKNISLFLASNYIESGQLDLANGIIANLLMDAPNDDRVKLALLNLERKNQEQKTLLENRWKNVEDKLALLDLSTKEVTKTSKGLQTRVSFLDSKVGDFKSNVEGFQELERKQWNVDITEKEHVAVSDFLYNLLREKRQESNALPSKEIDRHAMLARQAMSAENWEVAKRESTIVLRAEPTNVDAAAIWSLSVVSNSPEDTRNQKFVLPVLESILKISPGNPAALQAAAIINQMAGNLSLAEERYKKALESNPQFLPLKQQYASVLIKNNKKAEGVRIAKQLFDANKSEELALLIWEGLTDGADSEKLDFLQKWKGFFPNSQLPYVYTGDLNYKNGDQDKALEAYVAADKLKPNKATKIKIATILTDTKKIKESVPYIRSIISELNLRTENGKNEYQKYGYQLLTSLFEIGYFSDVIVDSKPFLEVFPKQVEIMKKCGQSYIATNDLAGAVEIYRKGIELDVDTFILPLLQVQVKRNDIKSADSIYKKYINGITNKEIQGSVQDYYNESIKNAENKK